jgi:nucleoside-diphosphate-sugar epimerase
MHILILGAAGMVGAKLLQRLARDGALGGRTIAKATLHDVVEPTAPRARPSRSRPTPPTSRRPARPSG